MDSLPCATIVALVIGIFVILLIVGFIAYDCFRSFQPLPYLLVSFTKKPEEDEVAISTYYDYNEVSFATIYQTPQTPTFISQFLRLQPLLLR